MECGPVGVAEQRGDLGDRHAPVQIRAGELAPESVHDGRERRPLHLQPALHRPRADAEAPSRTGQRAAARGERRPHCCPHALRRAGNGGETGQRPHHLLLEDGEERGVRVLHRGVADGVVELELGVRLSKNQRAAEQPPVLLQRARRRMAKPDDARPQVLSREDANSDGDLGHGALVAVPRVGADRSAERVADPQTAGHPRQRRPVAVAPEALVADHALERHADGGAGHEEQQAGVELPRVAHVLGEVQAEIVIAGQRQGALAHGGGDVVSDASVRLGQRGRGQPGVATERVCVVSARATEFDDPQDHARRDGSSPHAATISPRERASSAAELSCRWR